MSIKQQYIEIFNENQSSVQAHVNFWLDHVVFSWRWWTMVAIFIILWTLFWKLKKSKHLPRITIFGLLWIIVASNLDGLGFELGLWGYTYNLSPFLPKSYIFDYCLIPITYMLLYQYFQEGKGFLYANIILAVGASLIAEPVAEKLGLYIPFHWSFYISVPLYTLIAYILKLITEAICRSILKIN
ncbi:CBO0543 family protein [Sutcliffiella horikoshii]|uniref:CBO0543 family protein n=1 Tax=Sutcliffiella horikoshii TaxID=79883 RepID=UPI001CFE9879|nr:CBO0543 family protein [Sutcliffiella horikoshii]